MPSKRAKGTVAPEAAMRVAEGIGEAIGQIVNHLESLDAERAKAYAQLLALQERLNAHVIRFGQAIERVATTAASGRPTAGKRPRGNTRQPRARNASPAKTPPRRKKARIKCGVCGTPGHNARGHAKWESARSKK